MNLESMKNRTPKEVTNVCPKGEPTLKKLCPQNAEFQNSSKDVCPSSLHVSSRECHKEILKNQGFLLNRNIGDSCSPESSISKPIFRSKGGLKRSLDVVNGTKLDEQAKKPKMNSLKSSIFALKEELKQYFDFELEEELDEEAKQQKKEQEQKEAQRQLLDQEEKMKELRKFFESLNNNQWRAIFKRNRQSMIKDREEAIEKLVDISLFGPPIHCTSCGNGQIYYDSKKKTYVCSGYVTQYTKCMVHTRNPVRSLFLLPSYMDESCEYDHLPFNKFFSRSYSPEDNVNLPVMDEQSFRNNVAEELGNKENMTTPIDGHICDKNNRVIYKNGEFVDSKFPYAEQYHVYEDEDAVYSATLILTEIMSNKNSYFKLQLLENDCLHLFSLFQSWGRIGTFVGNTCRTNYLCLETAKADFARIFFKKTKNQWENRRSFEKHPGAYNHIKIDNSIISSGEKFNLSKPVRKLLSSLFDIDKQDQTWPMQYFDMDVTMPLGRVSELYMATSVLLKLQELVKTPEINQFEIFDLSNMFYNIIPHNFGMNVPEPISTTEMVDEKVDMLNILADTENSFSQIRKIDDASMSVGIDLVEQRFSKLRYNMKLLDPRCEDYAIISDYVKNTHGSTHKDQYTLMDVYEVKSYGNDKKMKAVGNRMLLWHGSKKVNYAGILKEGLRIAPKEAEAINYGEIGDNLKVIIERK